MRQKATSQRLTERARRAGYVPPAPKYELQVDYRGGKPAVDYMQMLLDPDATALLVIDMQNIFTDPDAPIGSPGGAKIIPSINRLAHFCRGSGIPVIWTLWAPNPSNVGRIGLWFEGTATLPEADPLMQLDAAMAVGPGDVRIRKPKYDAFWGTDLEAVLKTSAVDSIILTGIATDVCVAQTLVGAFTRDYNCVVACDGTATNTPYHEQTLWHDEKYMARVMTCDEVMAELKALGG